MKNTLLTIFTIFFLASCSKDDNPTSPPNPLAKLPPETQTGANTFGCVINNQVFYPRDGTSELFNPGGKGIIFWGDPSGDNMYDELEIRNLKDAKPANSMIIHLQNLPQNKVGEYIWQSSNFQKSIDGLMQNYVYAKIYDVTVNGWRYYGSYENSGKVIITRYDNIVSGTFSGKLRLFNGQEEINIEKGRFDINSVTIDNVDFP